MRNQTAPEQPDAPAKTLRGDDVKKSVAQERQWNGAELVGRTVTVNRPREELYRFLRDFKNLTAYMENITSVEILDETRSRWMVSAPGHESTSWISRITEDVPGKRIVWESEPGADVRHVGKIEFRDAPPGRGTQITAEIAYEAPGGAAGKLIAKVFQKDPQMQAARDLRRLKQLIETGEISTTEPGAAAPRSK